MIRYRVKRAETQKRLRDWRRRSETALRQVLAGEAAEIARIARANAISRGLASLAVMVNGARVRAVGKAARFMEFGTRRLAARPILGPAFLTRRAAIRRRVREALAALIRSM